MKLILVVLSVLTVVQARAESSVWYSAQSLTCEGGVPLKHAAAPDVLEARYQMVGNVATGEYEQIIKQDVSEGVTQNTTFNLTLIGKDTYIASSATDPETFTVSTGKLPESVVISVSDSDDSCGGAIVQTSAVQNTEAASL